MDAERGPAVVIPAAAADDIGHLLRRVYTRANHIAARALPPGTHPREFAVLSALAAADACSQQELAEQLGINRTVMVKLIDKLERAGQVIRRRNALDRRSYSLSVTTTGRRALAALTPAITRAEVRLTATLDARQRQRLIALLGRLLPDLDQTLPHRPEECCGYLLIQAHVRLRRRGDEALIPLGIRMRHAGALAVLHSGRPCTQQELAHQLGLTEPMMVQVVDTLQSAGLVERHRNPQDRRGYALELTTRGRDRLDRVRGLLAPVHDRIVDLLGIDGDQELRSLLRTLLG